MNETHDLKPVAVTASGKRAMLLMAALLLLALCACGQTGNSSTSSVSGQSSSDSAPASTVIDTPAYYVFESITIDDYTIIDPNELVMDGDGGHFENWYHLSLALLDGESGKLCTDGRIVNFTYDKTDGVMTLHAPTNEGIDFGFDGQKLEMGEGTLVMTDGVGTTVLRLVDEAPTPFAS